MIRNERKVKLEGQSLLVCEYSRLSSLFAARDVSQESLPCETSLKKRLRSDERRLAVFAQAKCLHISSELAALSNKNLPSKNRITLKGFAVGADYKCTEASSSEKVRLFLLLTLTKSSTVWNVFLSFF